MPASRESATSVESSQRTTIERALRDAGGRMRWRRAMRGLAATFYVPAAAAAGWVAITRFTLLEPPRWPVLLFPLIWFVALLAWALRFRPSRAERARFADTALGLDARVSTYVEMEGRKRIGEQVSSTMLKQLADDTVYMLDRQSWLLPSRIAAKVRSWQSAAAGLAIVALLAAIILPTSLDSIKAEKRVLDSTVATQAQQIADLRADLVSRPGLPDPAKQALDDQLRALEAQLRSGQLDRADALAAIAAAEEKVRSLAPGVSSADFDPLIKAAQQVQSGAAQSTDWDPSLSNEKDDLGKAADALDHAKNVVNQLTAVQSRGMAASLERAADVAGSADSELAQHMNDAGSALRLRDQRASVTALDAAKQRFRDAQKQEQTAEAVENTLSKLADGRQSIATAGAPAVKRAQLGFKRPDKAAAGATTQMTPGATASNGQQAGAATPGTGTPGAGQGADAQTSSQTTLGQILGQNQPAFGGGGGSTAGSGSPSQGSQQPGSGGQTAPGQGTNPTGSSGAGAGAGGQSGQNGGSATGGSGTQQGAISGPVRVGGASGSSGDAAGFGVGQSTSGQPAGQSLPEERLYVPGSDQTQRVGIGGQASPEQNPNGVPGRVGNGTGSSPKTADPGLGQANNIRTPYTEVLGKYTQQATDALDRAYVPPDAKEYVKNYFSALGK